MNILAPQKYPNDQIPYSSEQYLNLPGIKSVGDFPQNVGAFMGLLPAAIEDGVYPPEWSQDGSLFTLNNEQEYPELRLYRIQDRKELDITYLYRSQGGFPSWTRKIGSPESIAMDLLQMEDLRFRKEAKFPSESLCKNGIYARASLPHNIGISTFNFNKIQVPDCAMLMPLARQLLILKMSGFKNEGSFSTANYKAIGIYIVGLGKSENMLGCFSTIKVHFDKINRSYSIGESSEMTLVQDAGFIANALRYSAKLAVGMRRN